jgi:NADPH-dependent 2,4-dienoyl-CoA reductase/sulfur reductase-like enzyme
MSTVCDLLVVGAGPAGMAAASTAARLGVSTQLVDEQPALGGQIYRNVESHANDAGGVSAADWQRGTALVQEFRASGARHRAGTQVWQLDPSQEGACRIYVTDGTQADVISARRVLLATGAMERPVPIPGWTLPGVMTVGAAQILYKTGKHVPRAGTWIAGSGPLLWLFAAQALEAGGKIEGILDTAPRSNFAHALRHSMAALRGRAYLARGLALQARVRRAGVPVIKDVGAIEAKGEGRLTTLRFRAGGRWRDVLASTLLLHHGVVPNVHATRSLRAQHRWDGAQRCFVPVVDAWGMTSIEGYAVAGDGAGIVGAEASALRGRLAALESRSATGRHRRASGATAKLPRYGGDLARSSCLSARFSISSSRRAPSLLAPADDVLVCRCESITAGQVRDAVRLGCTGPNQMKAFTRCGMGPCQARMCGLAAAEIIARERGVGMEAVGVFNVRPPLKPLSLQELAALPE